MKSFILNSALFLAAVKMADMVATNAQESLVLGVGVMLMVAVTIVSIVTDDLAVQS